MNPATCARKVRHTSKESAQSALHHLQRKGARNLSVYGCSICGGYHVGGTGPSFRLRDWMQGKVDLLSKAA